MPIEKEKCDKHKQKHLFGCKIELDEPNHAFFTVCKWCKERVYLHVKGQDSIGRILFDDIIPPPIDLKKIAKEGQTLKVFIPLKKRLTGDALN